MGIMDKSGESSSRLETAPFLLKNDLDNHSFIEKSTDSFQRYDDGKERISINGDIEDLFFVQMPKPLSDLRSAVFNLTKSAVGPSIVVLPKAFSLCGLIPALTLISFAAIVTSITLHFLSRLSVRGIDDYISLGKKCFGRFGETFMVIIQLIFLLAPMTAYVKFNGVLIRSFMLYVGVSEDSLFSSTGFLSILSSFSLIYPLCLIRNMGKLSFASLLGLCCVAYITILVVLDFFFGNDDNLDITSDFQWFHFGLGTISALNTFILSFISHTSLLTIISELKAPTLARKSSLIILTQVIVFLFYFLTSVFGYVHYGSSIEKYDNILVIKPSSYYMLGQLLLVVVNTVTFPLTHFPARLSLDWILSRVISLWTPGKKPVWDDLKRSRHVWEAFALVSFSTFLAVSFQSVLDLFDLFVPITGSFIVFIIPALCFLNQRFPLEASKREIYFAYFALGMGGLLFFVGTPIAVANLIRK